MSLRVAFDMDGTVADMHAVLRQERERLFGPPAPRETRRRDQVRPRTRRTRRQPPDQPRRPSLTDCN